MHELGLIQNIFEILDDIVKKENLIKISKVNLRVGNLIQVVPENMKFLFDIASKGRVYESAVLNIEIVPVRGKCNECKNSFIVKNHEFVCPNCNCTDIIKINGSEFIIKSIEGD